MKKYEIRYFMDKDNYIIRPVDEEEGHDTDDILHEYTKGDYQTFVNVNGNLTRVNMNRVFYTRISEIRER